MTTDTKGRVIEAGLRRFVGYRPQLPAHYLDGGYANQPDQPQYEGVQFSDGSVVIRWLSAFRSTSVWASFDDLMAVHGHADYGTRIEWLDAPAHTGSEA